jgi:hypothetical protein
MNKMKCCEEGPQVAYFANVRLGWECDELQIKKLYDSDTRPTWKKG